MCSLLKQLMVGLCAAMLLGSAAFAQEAERRQPELPITRVVLYNSGIAYFEHRATVEGDAEVELQFDTQDINDLLKSMVLQDLGGGQISSVSYAGRDPLDQQLDAFSIEMASAPTMAELLQQLRGERVRIDGQSPVTGTVVGVELQTERPDDDGLVQREILNLLTDQGLTSVPLRTVASIQLQNQQLNQELQQALQILAAGRREQKRSVTLKFVGQGQRPVRVGYVRQTPVWKTSYRLVTSDKNESALLQGWAIVENTGELDWDAVQLTLVSGRPVSFQMDLYEPLYVQRPQVPLAVLGSPRPRLYAPAARPSSGAGGGGFGGGGFGGMMGGMGGFSGPQETAGMGMPSNLSLQVAQDQDVLDPSQGVQTQAAAAEMGEFFQYVLERPVSVARRRSALLPILNEQIEVEKLAIYTARVHTKHPLHALRLTNTSDVHWTAGPITVFEQGSYAGDARIQTVRPGEKRLISYAMDLETQFTTKQETVPPQITSASLADGLLTITRLHVRTHNYHVDNLGDGETQVLIEHPRPHSEWKVVEPAKADETTQTFYRYALLAAADKATTLQVVEHQAVTEETLLAELEPRAAVAYIKDENVPEDVKTALRELIGLKMEIKELSSTLADLQSQTKTIESQQSRIRGNMSGLDRTSQLYQRYVKTLEQQEDAMDELQKKITETKQLQVKASRKLEQLAPRKADPFAPGNDDPFQG